MCIRDRNEAEEAEKENINLYTVGFDLDDTTEIDETSTHPIRIYRHLINTREGDNAIDLSTGDVLGQSKCLNSVLKYAL